MPADRGGGPLGAIRLLNLRRLREQPLRVALAVVAIAAGVALSVGVIIDQASITRSARDFGNARAGVATFRVHGSTNIGGLAPEALDAVRAVDGVAAAAPVVQAVTIAEDADGEELFIVAFGVDCAVEAVIGAFGCTPEMLSFAAGGRPAISPSLAAELGDDGVVRTDLGRVPVLDAAVVPALDALNGGRVAVFSLAAAQEQFARDGALDVVMVVADEGADLPQLQDALLAAVGSHNVVVPADEPPDVSVGTSTLLPFLFLLSLFGLAIGAQLVYNSVALSLEERRHDIAIAAALGARPRALIGGVLIEAALLGAVGGALGVGGGLLLARPMASELSRIIAQVAGLELSIHVPLFAVVAGLLLGIVTSVVAAALPARRAVRAEIVSELHGHGALVDAPHGSTNLRAAIFLMLALGGFAISWAGSRGGAIETWQPIAAVGGMVTTLVCLFPASAYLVAPLLRRIARLGPLRVGAGAIALANLVANPRRARAMTMAVVVAMTMATMLGGLRPAITAGARDFAAGEDDTDVLISTLPTNNSGALEAKVSPSVLDALRDVPGVAGVGRQVFLEMDHPSVGLVGISAFDGAADEGSGSGQPDFPRYLGDHPDDVLARGDVVVGVALARDLGLRPGDALRVPGRDGFTTFEVGAVWGDGNNLGRCMTVSYEVSVRTWGSHAPSQVFLEPEADVSDVELAARVEALGLDPDLVAYDREEFVASLTEEISRFLEPFWALQRGMLLVSVIAAASTLLLVGVQRRREHALLNALGMRSTSLGRMMLIEAGAIGLAGSLLGTLVGAASELSFVLGAQVLTGLQPPYRLDPLVPVIYGLLSTALVMLGGLLPTLRVGRVEPAIALRHE